MALYRTVLYADEQSDVEIDGQAEQWLDDAAASVCHLADHVEDHS